MPAPITTDELLSAWEELARRSPNTEGYTSEELQDEWGVSRLIVLRRLHLLRRAGYEIVVGQRPKVRLDGKATLVPCYLVRSPAGAKPKRKDR